MRRTIDEPGFVHGDNGYRMGCGCGTCTEAQRVRRAKYEDGKRGKKLIGLTSELGPNAASVSGAHSQASAVVVGAMVAKTRAALEEIEGMGAEAELLREQALTGARMVDKAVASGRPHLVAAGNRILNESLDRLKALVRRKEDYSSHDEEDNFLQQYIDF